SSTDTLLELLLLLATDRSGLPSPLRSPTATEKGDVPVVKSWLLPKDGALAPRPVVFSRTDTLPDVLLPATKSGRPSPLKSPRATEYGPTPVVRTCRAAKDGVAAPGAVVFSSTDTVLPWLAA